MKLLRQIPVLSLSFYSDRIITEEFADHVYEDSLKGTFEIILTRFADGKLSEQHLLNTADIPSIIDTFWNVYNRELKKDEDSTNKRPVKHSKEFLSRRVLSYKNDDIGQSMAWIAPSMDKVSHFAGNAVKMKWPQLIFDVSIHDKSENIDMDVYLYRKEDDLEYFYILSISNVFSSNVCLGSIVNKSISDINRMSMNEFMIYFESLFYETNFSEKKPSKKRLKEMFEPMGTKYELEKLFKNG